jgi:hypothetical protein
MRYITKPTMLPSHKVCKRWNTEKYLQSYGAQINLEHQPKTEKLQNNTHTRDGVFPPVVVSVSKSSLFRF